MAQTVKTSMNQGTIQRAQGEGSGYGAGETAGAPGARNQAVLDALFGHGTDLAGSPIQRGLTVEGFDYSDPSKLKASFINKVTKGAADAGGAGHIGLDAYDLDFQQTGQASPPNLGTQALTADNPPANGFVPNPASPGEGSLNPADKPAVGADSVLATNLATTLEADGKAPFVGAGPNTYKNLAAQGQAVADRLQPPATVDG
jgi:hypothetical protein